MSDPLSSVRHASINGLSIEHEDEHYIINGLKFHETTKTFFKRTLQKAEDYYYTLRDILFFLENVEVSVAEYRRKAVVARITAVVEQDRQALKNYLLGVTDSCPQIDQSLVTNYDRSNALQSNQSKSATEVTNSEIPSLSVEKMNEQRQLHAALLDKKIKSKAPIAPPQPPTSNAGLSGLPTEKLMELQQLRRAQKRKSISTTSFIIGEDDNIDKEFIAQDRRILSELRKDNIPVLTRSSVLSKPNADYSFAIKIFNDTVLRPKDAKSANNSTSRPSSMDQANKRYAGSTDHPSENSIDPKKKYHPPIIIVPSAPTSCITTINVKEFLIDGMYMPLDDLKDKAREKQIFLRRSLQMDKQSVKIRVLDNPSTLSKEEWDQVVAVFVQGKLWQFKDWRYSTPVELFNNVLGVHVNYDDHAIDPLITSWNCKILKVNRFKPHLNAGASKEFWMYFDDFIKYKKPWLASYSWSV